MQVWPVVLLVLLTAAQGQPPYICAGDCSNHGLCVANVTDATKSMCVCNEPYGGQDCSFLGKLLLCFAHSQPAFVKMPPAFRSNKSKRRRKLGLNNRIWHCHCNRFCLEFFFFLFAWPRKRIDSVYFLLLLERCYLCGTFLLKLQNSLQSATWEARYRQRVV